MTNLITTNAIRDMLKAQSQLEVMVGTIGNMLSCYEREHREAGRNTTITAKEVRLLQTSVERTTKEMQRISYSISNAMRAAAGDASGEE